MQTLLHQAKARRKYVVHLEASLAENEQQLAFQTEPALASVPKVELFGFHHLL